MSSENREEVTESHVYGKETVGALLHRERVTRRISVQRVAEDLKFNEEYLVAIEESRYSDLPAIPYVRVYIRTIAQYLSLDGEELLDRFAKEIQIEFPDPEKERHETMRISIQSEKKKSNWIGPLIAVVVVIVVVLFYVNIRQRNVEAEENKIEVPTEKSDSTKNVSDSTLLDSATSSTDKVPAALATVITDTTGNIDTVASSVEKEELLPDTTSSAVESKMESESVSAYPLDSLLLTIGVTKDSSVVQVVTGRKKVFNSVLSKGDSKIFTGTEPIFVKVGRNGVVSYNLNGKSVTETGGGWTAYAKFTREKGFVKSNIDEWNSAR